MYIVILKDESELVDSGKHYICTWVEPPTSHALGTEVACEKTAWGVGGARGRRESRGALGKIPGSTGDCALEKW